MKILITDNVHPVLIERLNKAGYTVDYFPNLPYADLPQVIGQYTGIIINSKIKMTQAMIDLATNLEFIGRLGSGLDIIDLEYAAQKQIEVISTPGGNRNAVAEHALGMLLALSNNLILADQEVRKKIWHREANRGFEIKNKTIGLVGFGNTGQSFAEKLSGWVHKVLYYDKYLLQTPDSLSNIEAVSLQELQERSDIISFHIPLNSETSKMVNRTFLKKCKPGSIIINTSRGGIIETQDLIDALEDKSISGVCLDVFENEKPETYSKEEEKLYDYLFGLKNTIVTPHIAGWTFESLEKIANIMAEKIIHRS